MSTRAGRARPRGRGPRAGLPRPRHRPARPPRGLVRDRARRLVRARRRVRLRQVDGGARRSSATCRGTAASRAAGSRSPGATSTGSSSRGLREYHAQTVSMVYQNPGAALNPSLRIGTQVAEAFTVLGVPGEGSDGTGPRGARARCRSPIPASVLGRYPHQLSGGMQQRVVIAMALAKEPELLILDEPTTGLDATVEAEVLDLVSSLQSEFDTAVLFISHNLGVISKMCDRVGVLYAGRLVEEGPVDDGAPGSAASVHGRPPALHPARRRPQGQGPARHDPRLPAEPRRRDPGLRLRRPLRARRRPLPHRGAGARPSSAPGHRARCYHQDQAQDLPREEAANLELPAIDRTAAPLLHGRRPREGLQAARAGRPCARRRQRRDLAGRDARARRRVRQRQDDPRPNAARDRAADDRLGDARGRGARADVPEALARRPPLDPDRLPEPRFGAQPASLRAAHPAAVDEEARRRHRRDRGRAGARAGRAGSGSPSGR